MINIQHLIITIVSFVELPKQHNRVAEYCNNCSDGYYWVKCIRVSLKPQAQIVAVLVWIHGIHLQKTNENEILQCLHKKYRQILNQLQFFLKFNS